LIETNGGYSIGIDLPNGMPIEVKVSYPIFKKFGLMLEAGSLTAKESSGFHLLVGTTFFIANNDKFQIPVSFGYDFLTYDNKKYNGIGVILAYNHLLTKSFYLTGSVDFGYNFYQSYQSVIGYESKQTLIGKTKGGEEVYQSTPIQITKDIKSFENLFYIKPKIGIGFTM
jgi:hypothetical protein